jgi:hypothetical protein
MAIAVRTPRLPKSLEELDGLRAARWTRESTRGQYDNYGPEAQREQQDRAIRQEERTMSKFNNGHITPAEQKSLNQQENAVSREIGK